MDYVAIVDHMTVFAIAARATPSKTQDLSATDEQFHAIVKYPCPQPVLDQTRGYRIKTFRSTKPPEVLTYTNACS
jgi:hypothetical protein